MQYSLLTLVVALFLTSQAGAATTWWWIDGEEDELWSTATNWKDDPLNSSAEETAGEDPDEDAYITTSAHSHLSGIDPTALIATGVTVPYQPTLYIGGWLSVFDSVPSGDAHGDPHGHFGVLNITGGTLTADPDCRYMRLGSRGARGTVNQSAGTYTSCQAITLAYLGEDSVGFYNLSGGTVQPFGFDVGGQGTGIVDVTGGTIDSVHSGAPTRSTQIGRGITHPQGELYQPGVGVLLLSGDGTFKPENLRIGDSVGSFGVLTVREDATFEVLDDADGVSDGVAFVGVYGYGAVIQSGGDADLVSLILGRRPGGLGMYTLTGGELTTSTLRVGHQGGKGNLVVGGGSVNVTNYYQIAGSRLTFIVNDADPMITPIQVSGSATIPDGSVIDIDLANNVGTGYAVGSLDPVRPSCDQVLTLMTASQITGPSSGWQSLLEAEGYDGIPDDAAEWDLAVVTEGSNKVLKATYVSSSVCGP